MGDFSCKNRGCDITWKIENFNCLIGDLDSPTFFLGTSHKTELTLWVITDDRISKDLISVDLEKESNDSSRRISICYSVFISCGDESFQENGIVPFLGNHRAILIRSIFERCTWKNAIIRCHLYIISEIYTSVQRFCFRTVVEAELRKIKCVIPGLSTLCSEQVVCFPASSGCKLSVSSVPFEMEIISKHTETSVTVDLYIRRLVIIRDQDVLLHCKVRIGDTAGKFIRFFTHSHKFVTGENVWRFPLLIDKAKLETSPLSGYLDCELLISDGYNSSFVEKSSSFPICQNQEITEKSNLRDDLQCFYFERKCPDVELCSEGRKFPTHKAILSARSAVFRAMFNSDMQETRSSQVDISDVDAETLDRMLFFMYSDTLHDQERDSTKKLYIASDKYAILTLQDKCRSSLRSTLSVKNAIETLLLADMHSDAEFQTSVGDFICRYAKKIFPSHEWKTFIGSNSKLACEIMHKAWLESN